MESVIIARGHGYTNQSSGRPDCTAFDGFDVIANPLGGFSDADRERRILGRVDGKAGTGCDYGSHAIKLAIREGDRPYKGSRQLFILMQHGGGRVVYAIEQMYDGGETERALLAMPEAALYGILYTLAEVADAADRAARRETAHEWAMAFHEGRIRRRRAKGARQAIEIESEWETRERLAARKTKAA
jgi:hypothetical protein